MNPQTRLRDRFDVRTTLVIQIITYTYTHNEYTLWQLVLAQLTHRVALLPK